MKDTKRRLLAYQAANQSDVAEPSVHDFFREQNIQLFTKDCALASNDVMESIKIYVERVETPYNFKFTDESVEAKRRILVSLEDQV